MLRDGDDNPLPKTVKAHDVVRLCVNCFVVAGPDGRSVLIDCGAGGSWAYDDDQPTVRQTRLKVLRQASSRGTWITGAHLGRPGIGRLTSSDGSYVYEPAA